jgi:hypothetical protein
MHHPVIILNTSNILVQSITHSHHNDDIPPLPSYQSSQPIEMEDIHSPTIVPSSSLEQQASSTTTTTTTRNGDSSLSDLLALMKEKDRVESELKALGAVLDSVAPLILKQCELQVELTIHRTHQHKVNMNTSLTTFDAYPRDDIDVAQSNMPPSETRKQHLNSADEYFQPLSSPYHSSTNNLSP